MRVHGRARFPGAAFAWCGHGRYLTRDSRKLRNAANRAMWPRSRAGGGPSEQAAVAAVDETCRRLSLLMVRAVLDEALTVAWNNCPIGGCWPSRYWLGAITGTGVPRSTDQSRQLSPEQVAGDFDFDATRTSIPPPSTPRPPGTGSVKGRRSVLSMTPARGNSTCSSAPAWPRPRSATGSTTLWPRGS